MALIQVNFLSKSLMRTVPIQVILPVDKLTFPGMPQRMETPPRDASAAGRACIERNASHLAGAEEKPFKTLYLLHGIFGNYTDWVSGTNIQRWAEEKNLAVVMPSGENAFYVDRPAENNFYGEFIGQELVEITRKMFPLSRKREDTFIAGLSMGGYGALRNGLKYHETFGCIAGLSSAMIADGIEKRTDDTPVFIESRSFAESIFGNLDELAESDKNPAFLAKKLAKEGAGIPAIYLTCGTSDSLLEPNRKFVKLLESLDIPVTYVEGEGAHEWDFWNRSIKKVLDWLPLEEDAMGINSGNVGSV
ncbi:MAG: esterase family protein [Lachnospiraceae bacterium]|nr:esterase family protein [Lachnospiraceae bacterium]